MKLPVAALALTGALFSACEETNNTEEVGTAVIAVADSAPTDGGSSSPDDVVSGDGAPAQERSLAALLPRPPNATPPKNAWVHKRTFNSPEGVATDSLRNTSARYVDVKRCPEDARRAIAKLRLPQARVHSCEVRVYETGGEERRVALLLYGKPRECGEGCIYERKTVLVSGARVQPLDDVFFVSLPDPDEAIRAALPAAGVLLRLDAESKDRIHCSPKGAVWLVEGKERRWSFEAGYDDATCRVLAQTEERGGGTLGLLYELKVSGSASLPNALDEKWQPALTLKPVARRSVRFPKGTRASVSAEAGVVVIEEKLY